MKPILLLFLLFSTQSLFSQSDSRIDNISKNISELLIHKRKIDKSKYAIQIKKLYPKEDFSKFKDSPAEVILRMLRSAELQLPITWNNLLAQLNDFGIDSNSIYFKTYFQQMRADNYIVTNIIKSKSKFYAFSYNLLKWKKDFYISRFYKEIKKIENLKEIETYPFIIIQEETEKELKEMKEDIKTVDTLNVIPTN